MRLLFRKSYILTNAQFAGSFLRMPAEFKNGHMTDIFIGGFSGFTGTPVVRVIIATGIESEHIDDVDGQLRIGPVNGAATGATYNIPAASAFLVHCCKHTDDAALPYPCSEIKLWSDGAASAGVIIFTIAMYDRYSPKTFY